MGRRPAPDEMFTMRRSFATPLGDAQELAHEQHRRHEVHREVALELGGVGALEGRHGLHDAGIVDEHGLLVAVAANARLDARGHLRHRGRIREIRREEHATGNVRIGRAGDRDELVVLVAGDLVGERLSEAAGGSGHDVEVHGPAL